MPEGPSEEDSSPPPALQNGQNYTAANATNPSWNLNTVDPSTSHANISTHNTVEPPTSLWNSAMDMDQSTEESNPVNIVEDPSNGLENVAEIVEANGVPKTVSDYKVEESSPMGGPKVEPQKLSSVSVIPEWPPVMTFEPTMEEFCNLKALIKRMEAAGAHKAGIAKIRPPEEWVARRQGYRPSEIGLEIEAPVQQTLAPTDIEGAFQATHKPFPKLRVEAFRKLAAKPEYVTPPHSSYEELEAMFWNELYNDKSLPPIYGADVCDSITDEDQTIWNISHLESLLTEVMDERIPGVNLPYLYFGMWRACFSWHVEDMDLYGVNFLHHGAPKTWYCVPPQYAYKLEKIAADLFPGMAQVCANMLRHKACTISPQLLEERGLQVNKVIQEERDMIIVFPHAYHAGFNHGFNMAESTNFALERWIDYGKRFRGCCCGDKDTTVKVDMAPFISKYQPENLENWLAGQDFGLHPDDPPYIRAALVDAKERLEPADMKRFWRHLKERRDIPAWFHAATDLPAQRYRDRIDLMLAYDLSDLIMDPRTKRPPLGGPRLRALCRKLTEEATPQLCVRLAKLRKAHFRSYWHKFQRQEEYERQEAAVKKDPSLKRISAPFGFALSAEEMTQKLGQFECVKKHRFAACAKCAGCRRPNCGICISCADMPKFGGPGTAKQKCVTRICTNPIMRTCQYCVLANT